MKFRLLFGIVSVILLLGVLAGAVMAQEELPPSYAGLKNPFPWSDVSAQQTGEGLYRQSCLGCHGIDGGNIASANFGAADFQRGLEERPDLYFWIISEGRLAGGMPGFKSSLAEEQRWQILTYLWSLGVVIPPDDTPPDGVPVEEAGSLRLTAPGQGRQGEPLPLSATLSDEDGQPIGDASVKFFVKADFFISDLMEIGEAVTNQQGTAVFQYVPRQAGDMQVVARYQNIETTSPVHLVESDESFYQAEAGIPHSPYWPELFIGPQSAREPGEGAAAPTTGFRIPGGLPSLLLLAYIFAIMLVWSLYLRVMYQLFRIPVVEEMGDTNTRFFPSIVMTVMALLVILLVAILITGPYSNPHLFP